MPTILYQSNPLIYLRTKKTGSHSVKQCIKEYAVKNQISYLEVRSKDTDTLETHQFVSHMPAEVLSQRLDVWNISTKFTFIRNPWSVLSSYYYFIKNTGPKYGWNNPDKYSLNNINDFVSSLIDIHGTCNFNKEIYCINNQVIADVYDISQISTVMKQYFNIDNVPNLNVQQYEPNYFNMSKKIDTYIYRDYKWEIDNFAYTTPSMD